MNLYTLNRSKGEPIIGFTQKSQRTLQHGTNNVKICNLTTLNSMDPSNLIFVSREKIYLVRGRECLQNLSSIYLKREKDEVLKTIC
jgi:hypothetical protein